MRSRVGDMSVMTRQVSIVLLFSVGVVVTENGSNRRITPRRHFQTTSSYCGRIQQDASLRIAAKTSNIKLTKTSFTALDMIPHPPRMSMTCHPVVFSTVRTSSSPRKSRVSG